MTIEDDVRAGVADVLRPEFATRKGIVVPETEDINLTNGAVELNATYLYADMADSTGLAQAYKKFAVAKVIRCYLNAASRLIKARGGQIRSFDGDRVMGIFVGDPQATAAVMAAMNISWAVEEVIRPALKRKWSSFNWTMKQGVGIDMGEAMLVRGGVRGMNDIVSIGSAPNIAAKLSEIRNTGKAIHITKAVKDELGDAATYADGKNMWSYVGQKIYGDKAVSVYGTGYRWNP